MRVAALLFAIAIATVIAVPKAAADGPTVAVLPWTAADRDLEVYGEPLARSLVERLRKATHLALQTVTGKGKLPERIGLVIDGRIVGANDSIALEARIRDPELGRTLATEATRRVGLAQLDVATAELAQALAPALAAAVARKQDAARAIEIARPDAGGSVRAGEHVEHGGRRRMVVMRVGGKIAGGVVPVTEPATQAAVELAERLGFEPVPVADRGLLPPERARELTARHGASYALVLYVGDVSFTWRGVLIARGKLRVALIGTSGEVVFDRWVRTDTLVGSRGDRHPALVYFVAEQAGLIAQPLLAKLLR